MMDGELLSEWTVAIALFVGQNLGEHRMLRAFARFQGRLTDMSDRLDGAARILERKACASDNVLVAHGVQILEAFGEIVGPKAMDGHAALGESLTGGHIAAIDGEKPAHARTLVLQIS